MATPVQAQISFLWGHPAGVRTFLKRNSGQRVESKEKSLNVPSFLPHPPLNPNFPGQQLELNDKLVAIWIFGVRWSWGTCGGLAWRRKGAQRRLSHAGNIFGKDTYNLASLIWDLTSCPVSYPDTTMLQQYSMGKKIPEINTLQVCHLNSLLNSPIKCDLPALSCLGCGHLFVQCIHVVYGTCLLVS